MGDNQVYQKACKRFYTITFEYNRASIRHLVCTNIFACVRYRSGGNNCAHGCISMLQFHFSNANKCI